MLILPRDYFGDFRSLILPAALTVLWDGACRS